MANEQQIKEWINKHGKENVFKMTIPLPGEPDEFMNNAVGYFAKLQSPAFNLKRHAVYSRAMTAYKTQSAFQVGEIVLNETFLGGDERFKDINDLVYISAAQQLSGEIDFLSVSTEPISIESVENTRPLKKQTS